MYKDTLSIFGNKILSEMLSELKAFSKYNIKFYEDFHLCLEDVIKNKWLLIFFSTKFNENYYKKITEFRFPFILIGESFTKKKQFSNKFIDTINNPFSVLQLEKKIISLLSRSEFNKRSLIEFYGYIIDRNQRIIKKKKLVLQLTEKETNFLMLFHKYKKPLTKNFILENVWNYSSESETHTVETHIHRLRKKILEKFNDNNFIKNNKDGYYI